MRIPILTHRVSLSLAVCPVRVLQATSCARLPRSMIRKGNAERRRFNFRCTQLQICVIGGHLTLGVGEVPSLSHTFAFVEAKTGIGRMMPFTV